MVQSRAQHHGQFWWAFIGLSDTAALSTGLQIQQMMMLYVANCTNMYAPEYWSQGDKIHFNPNLKYKYSCMTTPLFVYPIMLSFFMTHTHRWAWSLRSEHRASILSGALWVCFWSRGNRDAAILLKGPTTESSQELPCSKRGLRD